MMRMRGNVNVRRMIFDCSVMADELSLSGILLVFFGGYLPDGFTYDLSSLTVYNSNDQ